MSIRNNLVAWAAEDRELRRAYEEGRVGWDEVALADAKHLAGLKRLVSRFGWRAILEAGSRSRAAAWLIVQHAPSDLDFQKSCLREWARTSHRDVGWQVALLADRVSLLEGKPQTYGTQVQRHSDGSWSLWPVKARTVEELDALRRGVGLPPFRSDYRALTGKEWESEDLPRAA